MERPSEQFLPETGESTVRAEARVASFLAEASRLLANSLDYETTLSTVARLALPDLGAWCIVDIVEESGHIRRVAVVHPDPDKQELTRELQEGWPPSRHDPVGVPAVARSLEPEIVRSVDDEFIAEAARDPRNREILGRLGLGSLMSVPLVARGDVLGAITFVAPPDAPPYGDGDLELATDLANRAAIAIDNARLYRLARRARSAAEMASQAKTQFLGVMSHELRTPINAILGYAQLLDMGVKGRLADEQRALLSRIEESGKHLLELVNRILDISRAEAGELTVQTEPVPVGQVVSAALNVVAPRVPPEIVLDSECDDDLQVLGDRIRVRQILVHLLTNAFRFTHGEGTVTVRCARVPDAPAPLPREGGPWIRIDIEDQGIGIPDDRIEAIFEPFVQGETNTFTRETDGSGLGLAISRYLARFMGGDLTVASDPGSGSTFSLWLAAPGELQQTGRDRRLFDRETHGLAALADHISRRAEPILEAYVRRVRADGAVPRANETSVLQLRDHLPFFLTGIASLLAHAEAGGDATPVLRGDNAIQRMVLELHGEQRRRLGWSADALNRDLDLLRRTIRRDVHTSAPPGLDAGEPLRVLDRLFEQAAAISLQAWQHADLRAPATSAAAPD